LEKVESEVHALWDIVILAKEGILFEHVELLEVADLRLKSDYLHGEYGCLEFIIVPRFLF
jgi:hypothetical protein